MTKTVRNYCNVFFYASIFWVCIGILHLGSLYFGETRADGEHYPITSKLWILFVSAYFTWAFLTTFVYILIEKNPPSKDNIRWLIVFFLTLFSWIIVIALINQYLSSILWGYKPKNVLTILTQVTPFMYLFNALKFAMIYGACTGIIYYRRVQDSKLILLTLERKTAEAMEKKSRFQLQALQSQLSPHFLFNALNSISGMARNEDNARIVETVAQLADLLRYAVEAVNQTEVTLDDELKFTANYLALQRIRFGDSFQYRITQQLSDTYVFCPAFCIQTLIENVFSHNEMSPSKPITIQLSLAQENNCIRVHVENSLSSPPNDSKIEGTGTGIALRNLTERLNLLYGDKAKLLTQVDSNTFSATIILPIRHEHD